MQLGRPEYLDKAVEVLYEALDSGLYIVHDEAFKIVLVCLPRNSPSQQDQSWGEGVGGREGGRIDPN
jgi:hypothetical protein